MYSLTCLHPRVLILGLLSAVVALPVTVQAQRREFAASYQLSNIQRSGGEVSFNLTLKIFNYSGSTIHNAGIVLYGQPTLPAEPGPAYGAFPLIHTFPALAEFNLHQSFTVPAAEFARWGHAEDPHLYFLKPDAEGNAIPEPIDMRRELLVPASKSSQTTGGAQ